MTRTTSTAFATSKNKQENQPRWLYEIETDAATLYLTNSIDDPTGVAEGITYNGQLYRAVSSGDVPGGPIWHEGLGENINGQMNSVRLGVGNSDQLFQAFVESEDGLRGKSVLIRMVFADDLSDATSKIDWEFTINASGAQATAIVFDLVWRNDPLRRQVPGGLFDKETFPNAPAPDKVAL